MVLFVKGLPPMINAHPAEAADESDQPLRVKEYSLTRKPVSALRTMMRAAVPLNLME